MIGIGKAAMGMRADADGRQRGLALLIVLWIIVAAALLVSAFNAAVKSGVAFVGSEVQLVKTEALLDAGAEIAAGRLIDEEEARRWVPDGSRHTVSFAGSALSISIRGTNGRIDLNKADKELLMGLLRQFAGSEAQAGRLRDRIVQARGLRQGEKAARVVRDAANEDPDAAASGDVPAFVDVAQLRTLTGMTPELYRAIAPYVTVYSGDGRINPTAAPDAVLMSMPGLTRDDVEKIKASAKAPKDSDGARLDLAEAARGYLTDEPGSAYLVTVEVMAPGAEHAAASVYVVAPALDGDAPYRLIARRPVGSAQASGAS
jgi:general secretion pathway protein K